MEIPDGAYYVYYDSSLQRFVKHVVTGVAEDGLLVSQPTAVSPVDGNWSNTASDSSDSLQPAELLPVPGDVPSPGQDGDSV